VKLNLQELLSHYSESEKFKILAGKLNGKNDQKLRLAGLVGSVDAILATTLYKQQTPTQVFIFNDEEMQNIFIQTSKIY